MFPVILVVLASVLPHPAGSNAAERIVGDMPRSEAQGLPEPDATHLAEYLEALAWEHHAALTDELHDLNGPYRAPPPPTTTTVASRRSNYGSGVEQWRGLVADYFGSETDLALRVMKCESRGDPNAQNRRSSAAGLFQILKGTWQAFSPYPWGDRYHPRANVHTAKRIRDGQGWQAWSC